MGQCNTHCSLVVVVAFDWLQGSGKLRGAKAVVRTGCRNSGTFAHGSMWVHALDGCSMLSSSFLPFRLEYKVLFMCSVLLRLPDGRSLRASFHIIWCFSMSMLYPVC